MMQDLEKIGEELKKRGQAEKLNTLASSADGRKLGRTPEAQAMAEAFRSGDAAALSDLAGRLLATEEGQRLSAELQKLLGEKRRG